MKDPQKNNGKLGFVGLASLVFGMMVGAGIFNIPQNMAASGGLVGVLLAWALTALGMLVLVYTFKTLSRRCPRLNEGLYLYARHGFGDMTGFLTVWGYWLCTAFANVAYLVMLTDTLGSIFPPLLTHGWVSIAFGSALIWAVYFLVSRGIHTASLLNNAMSIVKMGCIIMIIVLLWLNIKHDTFSAAFQGIGHGDLALPEVLGDMKGGMMVTLWCFIGIEGAVMMSGRARRAKDVGRAGITGFLAAWLLYVLVTLLSYGIMSRARLAGLDNPSAAYALRAVCGEWAYWFVIASVILSISGGWIAWSLVCAEVPCTAARRGLFPRCFKKTNSHGIPWLALAVSSVTMELFLLLVSYADDVYLTALNITGMMILPAYLLTGLYLWKISRRHSRGAALLGMACTLYCLWMIYAGGLDLFMETSLFYLPGLLLYRRVRHERRLRGHSPDERYLPLLLLAAAALSAYLLLRT